MDTNGLLVTTPAAERLAAATLIPGTIVDEGLNYDNTANEMLVHTGTFLGTDLRGRVVVQRIASQIRFLAVVRTMKDPIGLMDHIYDENITDEFIEDFAARALDTIKAGTPIMDSFPGRKVQGHR